MAEVFFYVHHNQQVDGPYDVKTRQGGFNPLRTVEVSIPLKCHNDISMVGNLLVDYNRQITELNTSPELFKEMMRLFPEPFLTEFLPFSETLTPEQTKNKNVYDELFETFFLDFLERHGVEDMAMAQLLDETRKTEVLTPIEFDDLMSFLKAKRQAS